MTYYKTCGDRFHSRALPRDRSIGCPTCGGRLRRRIPLAEGTIIEINEQTADRSVPVLRMFADLANIGLEGLSSGRFGWHPDDDELRQLARLVLRAAAGEKPT